MSALRATKKIAPKDPRAIAEEAAVAYFDALIGNRPDGNGEADEALWKAFETVSDALEAEHEREHGPIKPDEDLALWDIGMTAGYLVGVQVGLRLRSSGGAR